MIKQFINENANELYQIHKDLCLIPAPSHFEHQRAEYCLKWFQNLGLDGAYIDEALNVIVPINAEGSNELTVFVAHTDTVFPDREPMPYVDDGEYLRCPGVGDDTASVAVLMETVKYFVEKKLCPPKGVLFVCNSCEEGLGNLKGTRQLFKDFDGRIAQFISFDGKMHGLADHCTGSHRYEVEVLTEGGHSFGAFGNKNAIAELAAIISKIYAIEVPKIGNSKTTYNVGGISGGTSVNTIAQSAKMLCEYRSDNFECLGMMKEKFEQIFAEANTEKVTVNVELIGERPCENIDYAKVEALIHRVLPILEEGNGGKPLNFHSSSTDCNIPLSMGIPAFCMGVYTGGGAHTREEWVEKASMIPGLEVGIKSAIKLTEVE